MRNTQLHEALVETISQFKPHLTHAVTLTFKTQAYVKPRSFERYYPVKGRLIYLNEEIAISTLNYFYQLLTSLLFGKDSKRTSTKAFSVPLMISSLEGLHNGKRLHAHLAIGNLPPNVDIYSAIARAWEGCDFGDRDIVVKPLSNSCGWITYITKEAEVGNLDVLSLQDIKQPQIYLSALA